MATVLVIDDDYQKAREIEEALNTLSAPPTMRHAFTLDEAQKIMSDERPEYVILDYRMPGYDTDKFARTVLIDSNIPYGRYSSTPEKIASDVEGEFIASGYFDLLNVGLPKIEEVLKKE